jgi:hypothetical protein
MRYFKARKITCREAASIIKNSRRSLNEHVVISQDDDWYDIRSLTAKELDDFVADLERRKADNNSSRH